MSTNIFIPFDSRCCRSHINDCNLIYSDEIKNILTVRERFKLTGDQLSKLLFNIRKRDQTSSTLFQKFEDYKVTSSKLFIDHTGFSKEEFLFILNELKSLKNSSVRTKEQALAVYLSWLKTGIPQETLASFFGINFRQTISNICSQVRESFMKDFVPQFLGCKSLSRERWLEKNTDMVKELFSLDSHQLSLFADGTFLYCQKPENNYLQRLLYSCQKKRHLVKPFIVCCSNGYVVDVFGPFPATANDASILLYLMNNSELKDLTQPNDLFILDRGFRDSIQELKQKHGLIVKTPACNLIYKIDFFNKILIFNYVLDLGKKNEQLTTLQANETRLVTKARWVIEDDNGVTKQSFRSLDGVIQNKLLPHIIKDYKIASALKNCFYTRKISDIEDSIEIAQEMKKKLLLKNDLDKYLTKKSRNNLERIDLAELLEFPKLSIEMIRKKITFGWYQINQCLGYISEHFDKKGDFEIRIVK
jgi:hypothetical protein